VSRPSWRRNLDVTVAMVFVVFLGFAFVLPFLPLYVRELGVRDEESVALWSGVLIGIAPLLAGLLAPAWGRLAERYGQKPMALRALLATALLLLVSAAVTSPWQLLATRVGIGLFGGIGPLGLAMATALMPRELTGRAVGAVQSAQILSAAIGPFAGGFLADAIGIRSTFVVTGLIVSGAFLLVARFYEEGSRVEPAGGERASSFGAVLASPGVPALLVVLFLVNFVGRSFTPILPLHLEQLGVPRARLAVATGVLISAYSLAAAASAAGLGRLSRSASPSWLLIGSLFGAAVCVFPMPLVASFLPFLALAVLLGLASGGSLTLCYTIGGLIVPADRRITAFGFFAGAALFGGAVSPSVAGLLAHFELRAIYFVDAAISLALAAALLRGPRVAAPAAAR
jgi:MFS transporter, DHA1 family, multidrug resistance protein